MTEVVEHRRTRQEQRERNPFFGRKEDALEAASVDSGLGHCFERLMCFIDDDEAILRTTSLPC